MDVSPMRAAAARELLRWLEAEPAADLGADLAALRERLPRCVAPGTTAAAAALPGAAAARAFDIASRLRAQLLAATLPLPDSLAALAGALGEVLLELARGHARLAEAAAGERALALRADALALVAEAFMLAGMAAAAPPAGLWQLAHALALRDAPADADADADAAAAMRRGYLRMLCLTAAQPEGMTAREFDWVAALLDDTLLDAARLVAGAEAAQEAEWFVAPDEDAPPRDMARHPSTAEDTGGRWYFDPRPLAPLLDARIQLLSSALAAMPLASGAAGCPLGLAAPEMLAQLRRLRSYWSSPQLRQHPRTAREYAVEVAIGLKTVWELGRRDEPQRAGRLGRWRVVNESDDGFAIESEAGIEGGIEPGVVLALRASAAEPWVVCVVRRARSLDGGRLGLGVQRLGSHFVAARVAFGDGQAHPVAALLLPALPPARPHAALLVPAGSHAPGAFALMPTAADGVAAPCRALGVDLRTTGCELFQFESAGVLP